ncbi:hypothetical protein SR1949_43320 [Sphaerospermopsis reniformis]|uniref:Uncharacterized protein n=1 Tax=Sphaerospermopsis reniformis TaxID=531300 RepID=A0A480A325_9CYAN|nr:hypothetical protein NIES73_50880 [Sphaerospermopsis kisseleviana NIES-73]GCL39209.1 hypothetical protein SR1949_43320 [Sphaerospermopsis reniformis]
MFNPEIGLKVSTSSDFWADLVHLRCQLCLVLYKRLAILKVGEAC